MSRTIDIPTPDRMLGLMPELADALREAGRLREERRAARVARDKAKAELAAAKAADTQAEADLARGKRKTAKPTAPAAEERLAKAERSLTVLSLAAADADAEIRAEVEGHKKAIASRLDEETERLRADAEEAARSLRAVLAERDAVRALIRWLDTARFAPGGVRDLQLDLKRPSGEQYMLGQVLPKIEAALGDGK
jgi:hypothetical protein